MSGRAAKALRRLAERHGWSRFQYQAAKRGFIDGNPIFVAVVRAEVRSARPSGQGEATSPTPRGVIHTSTAPAQRGS